jgi:hypothetical protein
MVLENRLPRRVFVPSCGDVTGGWRKLHVKEFCILYSSPVIIKRLEGHFVELMGEMRKACTKLWLENLKGRGHL